jgi:hypothetical protein
MPTAVVSADEANETTPKEEVMATIEQTRESAAGRGGWGLPWTLRRAEPEARGAQTVLPAAHGVIRCALCNAGYDARAGHYCTRLYGE